MVKVRESKYSKQLMWTLVTKKIKKIYDNLAYHRGIEKKVGVQWNLVAIKKVIHCFMMVVPII